MPPLYRISHGGKTVYARDDDHREELMNTVFKNKKPEVGRFKGLGEMMPAQLKETTMNPQTRTLARVTLPRAEEAVEALVETLMGRKPELALPLHPGKRAVRGGGSGRLIGPNRPHLLILIDFPRSPPMVRDN